MWEARYTLLAAALALALSAPAAEAQEDAALEQKVAEVNARYESEWARIREESEDIKDRAPEGAEVAVGIELDCEMKRQEIKLDIPEVTMKRADMSLHLPQVTMKTTRMSWDNPETYMGTTICGYYPEFHRLQVKMSPIKCDLPQVRMVRREMSMDIPEFRWDVTEIKMDLPEFRMVTQRWSFDLPECKVSDVSVETQRMKDDSARLQDRATLLAEQQRSEVVAAVSSDLIAKRQQVDITFNNAIEELQRAITKVREYGIDPAKVRQENGGEINLMSQLVDIQTRRQQELAKLDDQIAALSAT